jgi:hypothetical protein
MKRLYTNVRLAPYTEGAYPLRELNYAIEDLIDKIEVDRGSVDISTLKVEVAVAEFLGRKTPRIEVRAMVDLPEGKD